MKKYIYLMLTAILAAGTLLTLHDMQVSEGMGLYLALQSGHEDRRLFDIAVDIAALLLLAILLWIPFCNTKPKTSEYFFRIMVCYLAFMPGISTAYILHFFTDFSVPAIAAGEEILINAEKILDYIRLLAPFTILLGGVYCFSEGQRLLRKHIVCGMASIVMLSAGAVLSGWTDMLCFIAIYLLLLVALDLWKKLTFTAWPIYGILFFKCIYNFYDIMAKYN